MIFTEEKILEACRMNEEGVDRFSIVTAEKLTGEEFDKAIHAYELKGV